MFEVGKLSDESMDSFLSELEKVWKVNLHRYCLLSLRKIGDVCQIFMDA